MTNGEKIKEIFPQAEIIPQYINMKLIGYDVCIDGETYFSKDWWNMKYCRSLSSSEKPNKLEIPTSSTTETLISLDVYNQVVKERDIAIQQLHELGYEFGQKIESTTKNDLGVDAISRQALLNATVKKSSIWNYITNSEGDNLEAIVSKLPPVTPQEPILDKIRAEIEGQKEGRYFSNYDMHIYKIGLKDAIDIIDKYKAESEKE